jgi:hypothetical protein
MPCEPPHFYAYVVDQSHYSILQYVRYSTANRLDLIAVDPRDQLIPLAPGNTWSYRAFTGTSPSYLYGVDWEQWKEWAQGWKDYPSGIDSAEWNQKWRAYRMQRIRIMENIFNLSRMLPDTLRDKVTLPLKARFARFRTIRDKLPIQRINTGYVCIEGSRFLRNLDRLIPEDFFPEENYYNSIYPGGASSRQKYTEITLDEMELGSRMWYISGAQRESYWSDDCYVFSSDPRGVIVGTVHIPSTKRMPVRGDDTVTFVDFIPNDPQPYDACGTKTGWELQVPITTPAGVFRCYRFVSASSDTLYFARGIGVVRTAGHRVRYTRDSPSYWKGTPNPPPNFLQLASYHIR